MNDFKDNNIFNSNNIINLESSLTSSYDWYDYREVIERQDTIIVNQSKTYDLIKQGFTFISFILVIFLLYSLIKNMIRK